MTAYKFLRQVGTIVVLGLTLALLALPAAAVTVTWDPNGDQHTDSGGTWTTSAGATNWYTGTGDTAWTNGGTLAAFGWGTGQTNPYTVTLGSAITAGGLVFNNQNYTIAGGGNTLTLSAAPTITVNAASAAISATIAGAASSLTKSGAGTLVLTSFNGNAYSGGLALNGGTLQFGDGVNSSNVAYGGAMSGANTLVIASNSTFTLSSGNYNQLANNVVVNGDLSSSSGRANTLQNATVTLNGGTLDGGGGDPTYGTLLFYSQGQIVANGAGNVIQGAASASSPTIGLAAAVTLNTPQPGDALTISAGIGHPYGNGTLTKNGSGSVFVTGNLSAGNTVNVNAGLFSLSGANSLTWVVSVNGGTLAIAGGSTTLGSNYIVMGNAGAAANKPYFVQTGGSFSTNGQTMYLGNATGNGMSTVNVSGGTFTSGQLWLGVRAPTTVNISSSASVTASNVNTSGFGGTGVLNLGDGMNFSGGTGIGNGGTSGVLTTGSITGSNLTFNFKGGTLKPTASQGNFFPAIATATVQDAGGVIDNGGFNITIAQPFAHGGVAGTDGGLIFQGAGTTILTGSNSYNGGTTINGGTLQVGNVSSSGRLGAGAVSNNAALVFNRSDNYGGAVSNSIGGSGSLNVSAGALVLGGNNTYTGPTMINGGALYLNGANATTSISVAAATMLGGTGSAASATANVADGGILDFSQNTGSTFSLGSLNFAGGGTINIGALANYTAAAVLNAGALTTSGSINVNANLGSATVLSGTYDLIGYTGSIGGTGSSAFAVTVNGLGTRQQATLFNNSASNQIDLAVTGFTPYWRGTQADWLGANAWTLKPGNTPTTFQTGDSDVFDDTASGSTYGGTVLLNSGNVSPGSIGFTNSALSYTVSGNFGITGSANLAISGGGTVTIATSNGYTGGTTLTSGLLNLANSAALGTGPLNLGGGTLDNTSGAAMTLAGNNAQNWNGNFTFHGSNPLNLGSGSVSMNSSLTTVTVSASALTVGGAIGGGGALTKNGGGLLVLAGANTYPGTTTITAGTLQLGNGGTTGGLAAAGTIVDNATLAFNRSDNPTQGVDFSSSPISGGGSLVQLGPGMLTLIGNNTFSQGTIVSGGTLQLNTGGNIGTLQPGAPVTVNSGATLLINAADGLGYYNGSTGTIGLVGGTMTIATGIHTNLGPLSMTAGTMTSIGAGNGVGTTVGTVNINYILDENLVINAAAASSVINANAISIRGPGNAGVNGQVTFNVARGAAPVDLVVSSPLYGAAAASGVIKAGPGIMVLAGGNTYVGGTTISGGTLVIGAGGTLGSLAASSSIGNNGTLAFNRSDNPTQGVDFSTAAISGTGSLVQMGGGVLTLNAANTYSGGTTIASGTLSAATIASGASNLGNAATPIALGDNLGDQGTLNYTGASATFAPGLAINSGGGQLLVANASPTLTIGGVTGNGPLTIGGAGNATVTGPLAAGITSFTAASGGTVTLAGNNAYSGSTAVTSGALYLNGSNATSSISVAGGATLGGSGSAASAGANVANGGILDFSQNTGSTFALASLNFLGGATINLNDAGGQYAAKPAISAGTLTTASTINLDISNVPNGTGTMQILRYTGAIGGSGSSVFNLAYPVSGGRSLYSLLNAGNFIELSYSQDYPYWTGAGNRSWDLTSTNNWKKNSNNAATTFQTGDNVVFDDRAVAASGTAQVVNVNGADVQPSSVTFSNTAAAYTLQGSNAISGGATLTVNGAGAVTIANANSYAGGTTLASGLLNLANSAALGTGPLNIGGGTLDNTSGAAMTLAANNPQNWNGSFTFRGSSPLDLGTGAVTMNASPTVTVAGTGALTVDGAISGNGALTKNGPGTLVLTASNSYLGATTVTNGTLQLGTGVFGFDGSVNGPVTTNAALVYNLNSFQTAAYSVGGSGSLAMIGPGMLTLSASNGYTGGTTVAAGVLQLGNSAALGAASGSLSIVAGTLDLAGYSPSVGALSGGASGAILNSGTAATLTTNTAGGSSTFAGTIADGTGTVALTTAGSGALVLTGNNTYSGATTVGGGTLTVAAGGAIGSASRIYVNGPNGAVLNVSGGVVATSDNEVWALSVGYSANQPGAVNISAGTVNLSGANSGMVMGNGGTGATAQWNQTGGLVNVGNGTIYAANNPGGSTQMVISGGTFNAGGEFWLGTRDDATLTVSGNAVVNLQGNMWINRDYSGQTLNSVFNMQGGAVSQGGSYFVVGNGLGTGTFNQTGGFFDCTSAAGSYIGNGTSGAGIMSVSGGTFTQTTDVMRLGQNGNATGSLSVGGGTAAAIVSVPTISFGNNSASAAGTVNLLSKGLLEVGTITQGPGFGTFNFDGGTLQATGVNATFMQGLTNAYVEDAGGAVDNGGYAITIAQNLQHGGSSVTDGGLIFRGAGVTTLSGTNAYNGGTTVNNGTLIVTNSQAINDGTNLSVGDPALLSLLPAPVIPGAVAGLPTEPQSAVAPVPEPGTLVLAAVAGVAAAVVAVRRKRISRRVYQ